MAIAKPDFSDPASVVRAFIHAMHCWESLAGFFSECAQAKYRPDDDDTLHSEEERLDRVLRQLPPFVVSVFLTKRDRAYVPSGSYSTPPEYNASREKVTRVVPKTKSMVVVETDRKSDYMGGLREYVLKKQDGIWLIDSVSATLLGKKRKLTLV